MGSSCTIRLNHVANQLASLHFDAVVAMLMPELGFVELRRTKRSVWLRQPGSTVDPQLSRSDTTNRDAAELRSGYRS